MKKNKQTLVYVAEENDENEFHLYWLKQCHPKQYNLIPLQKATSSGLHLCSNCEKAKQWKESSSKQQHEGDKFDLIIDKQLTLFDKHLACTLEKSHDALHLLQQDTWTHYLIANFLSIEHSNVHSVFLRITCKEDEVRIKYKLGTCRQIPLPFSTSDGNIAVLVSIASTK